MVAVAEPASAGLIDNFADWSAFSEKDNGDTVCWIASQPKKSEGKYSQRGTPYVMVAHRPKEKAIGVVSINAGYTYRKNSRLSVNVGDSTFHLFTSADTAWAENYKDDTKLVRAMSRGSVMIVKGTSSRGTRTTDTYSLKGFTAAYKAITSACGIK